MLAVAEFVVHLAGQVSSSLSYLKGVRQEQREAQSEYLDHISETLAEMAVAIGKNEDISKFLAELKFHLENINGVLRFGDPKWSMATSDKVVEMLRAELDSAVERSHAVRALKEELNQAIA